MNVYKRLSDVQKILKAPKNQFNNFGKYKYRSCEDILEAAKPICIENGLVLTLTDKVVNVGDSNYIEATAMVIDIETSQAHEVSASARESVTKKGMDDSQITGTASSYARKYALNGLFCIDDTKDADTDIHTKQTQSSNTQSNEPTERKVSTKELKDLANQKHVPLSQIFEMYKKDTGKTTDDIKWLKAEYKVKYYDMLTNMPGKQKKQTSNSDCYGSSNVDIAMEAGMMDNGW